MCIHKTGGKLAPPVLHLELRSGWIWGLTAHHDDSYPDSASLQHLVQFPPLYKIKQKLVFKPQIHTISLSLCVSISIYLYL